MREKEKNKKKLRPKILSIILIIVVLALGVFIARQVANNFFKALSEKREITKVEYQNVGMDNINFNELFGGTMERSSIEDADKNSPPAENTGAEIADPAEAYLVMRKEFSKIKTMDDLVFFAEKYGSEKNIFSVRQLKTTLMFIGEEKIVSAITSAASEKIESAEILSSSENKATIKIIAESGRAGEVIMVFERGSWRFDKEKW